MVPLLMSSFAFPNSELPNDTKMFSFPAGELSNSATYFSTFADVSSDIMARLDGTFGTDGRVLWKPVLEQKEDGKIG